MSLTLWAEWLRFRRSRANLIIVATYCAVLVLCGLWSAYGAQQHRHGYVLQEAARDALIGSAQAVRQQSGGAAGPKAAAMQAFTLGRSKAGLAQLPALSGLTLSLSLYDTLNTHIAVSVESRYADGRRSDALSNPVLDQIGAMDLAAIVILLMPLIAIGLCAGAVQEDRERGVWRTMVSQSVRPWRPFYMALAIRTAALFLPSALACGLVDCRLVDALSGRLCVLLGRSLRRARYSSDFFRHIDFAWTDDMAIADLCDSRRPRIRRRRAPSDAVPSCRHSPNARCPARRRNSDARAA